MPIKDFLILLFVVLIFIIFNIVIYKIILYQAGRFFQEYSKKNKYTIVETKFTGLFSTGNFKKEFSLLFFTKGGIFHYTYVYLIVKDERDNLKKITARIETMFFKIIRIDYC